MGKLTSSQEAWLREKFGDRFSADLMERKIYSHDVGVMPSMVKPLIGKALADAIVQPQNEEEIIALVRWANQNRIPLVPRGKATSGYGGIIPVKGGIIVTFWNMRGLVSVDADNLTATVQPGIVWQNLETELAKQGLALRLYPSSAPSSTVAGWLAQGGFGYGSFEYLDFPRNVVSARVVLPSGEVREFSGADLDLIADAEGITGIITQITLRVRPLEEEVVVGGRFANVAGLTAAVKEIVAEKLPLWSATFINPKMAHLKNNLPPKIEHGHPVEEHGPKLPEEYLATFVFPASRAGEVREKLEAIIAKHGSLLPAELAHHEWEERFSIMHVKRLGPSLIPSEVVLPLENLEQALTDIETGVKQPLVIEGMIAGGEKPQVVLLGFIHHDERNLLYNVAFALALSTIEKAKKYGGRAYASGLYFVHEAENILGAQRVRRLREFKGEVDPQKIMNPGKILDRSLMSTFMGIAGNFEPLIRMAGNMAKVNVGQERMAGAGKRGIPDNVAWYAYTCAQCGYCVDNCTEYYSRGWESTSPRGKWFFLREYMHGRAKLNQEWVNKFMACTTCERCDVECPLELPIEPSWMDMRGALIHDQDRLTLPPFEIMRASTEQQHNIWGAYQKDRAAWAKDLDIEFPDQAEIAYFPGCTASYVEQDIAQSSVIALSKAGVDFTYLGEDEACCGIPMLVAGKWDTFVDIMKHNVAEMKKRGVKKVVTTCPACWLVWHTYYPQWAEKVGLDYPFEAVHISEVLSESVEEGKLEFDHEVNLRVTWHDSCHMGRAGGIYEPPREVLTAIPGLELVEMEHNREHGLCCGGVLSLIDNPEAAKIAGDMRLSEADAVGAEAIVSTCPCCQVQLRVSVEKTGRDLPVMDFGGLVAQGLGIPYRDSTGYALEQWATFEAMIELLRPENMADLMVELFPQMVDAMPMGMGGMMRAIGKMGPVGGAILKGMKPLFPVLFPIMMPGMMDKVMPDMLKAVEKRVPMPDYMKEQMPDLMPSAMDGLLSKMLPSIVPLISDPLIDYLRSGK